MSNLPGKLGLWNNQGDKCLLPVNGKGYLHAVKDLGFQYLVYKCVHRTGSGSVVDKNLAQVVQNAATVGLEIVPWAYVYPDGINSQMDAIAEACALVPNARDLILDAEAEWEKPGTGPVAETLCHGIAAATSHRLDLHLSSFGAPASHGAFPFAAFARHCAGWMPQAYAFGSSSAPFIAQRALRQSIHTACLGGLLIPTVNRPDLVQQFAGKGAGLTVWLDFGEGEDAGVFDSPQALQAWQPVIQGYPIGRP